MVRMMTIQWCLTWYETVVVASHANFFWFQALTKPLHCGPNHFIIIIIIMMMTLIVLMMNVCDLLKWNILEFLFFALPPHFLVGTVSLFLPQRPLLLLLASGQWLRLSCTKKKTPKIQLYNKLIILSMLKLPLMNINLDAHTHIPTYKYQSWCSYSKSHPYTSLFLILILILKWRVNKLALYRESIFTCCRSQREGKFPAC